MTTRTKSELEDKFLQAALRRSDFYQMGQIKRANREFDKIHELKNAMRALPDKGVAALRRISENKNVDVKLSAAAALLAVEKEFAMSVLRSIAQAAGYGSSDAQLNMDQWRQSANKGVLGLAA